MYICQYQEASKSKDWGSYACAFKSAPRFLTQKCRAASRGQRTRPACKCLYINQWSHSPLVRFMKICTSYSSRCGVIRESPVLEPRKGRHARPSELKISVVLLLISIISGFLVLRIWRSPD